MAGDDMDLRSLLETLDPKARDDLRRVLILNRADRGSIASRLLRYGDGHGDHWADIIDMLTMHPEEGDGLRGSWARSTPRASPPTREHLDASAGTA